MNNQDNTPNASRLVESLRYVGYDNYSAIADLIDNSIDALAGIIKVEIGTNNDGHLVTISDNGIGMDIETLDQAIRLGSKTNKNSKSDLGKYGLGLITASISFSRRLVIITKKEGHYLTAQHDLDEVSLKDKFVRTIRESNDEEKNFFMQKLGGSMSGTILILSKIDRLQNSNLSIFRSTLISHLGQVFRYYIDAGKKIYVQDKEVKSKDPLMLNSEDTDILIDGEHEFEFEKGNKETIKLLIVCLPKFSKQENDLLRINQRTQGFYVMRNHREIASGESFGIFTKHNDLNRFRAEIHFSGSLDATLGTSFTKDEIKFSDEIRSWIESATSPQIQSVRERAKKSQSKEIAKSIDHQSSERVFKDRAKLLPTRPTKITTEKEDDTWRQQHIDEVSFSDEQHGPLAPLFTYTHEGKKIHIRYNAEHPFYVTVFEQTQDNKDLLNAIDFLTYSICAGLTRISSEKNKENTGNFLVSFSDNLRTLLGS